MTGEHPHIWVDFNDIREHGTLTTLAQFARSEADLYTGAVLLAVDEDGNQCRATVVDRRPDGVVTLALDRDTFRPEATKRARRPR